MSASVSVFMVPLVRVVGKVAFAHQKGRRIKRKLQCQAVCEADLMHIFE